MEFKYLPKDILSSIFSLVDLEDLVWIGSCGNKEFMERLSREGLVPSVTLTGHLSCFSGGSGSFPFSTLSTPVFSSLTRIVIRYETLTSGASSWLWDPCFLPSTLTEIDFSFENAFEVFLQPLRDVNNPHWMPQSMYSNRRASPDQLFTPMLLCDIFPKLENLRISGSLFSPKQGFPVHWGVKRPYRDLLAPTLGTRVNWTKAMFWRFLKNLPSSLTSLDLSISAYDLDEVPELPPNLTSLRCCEGVAPATHTPRFWLRLAESHRPDLSTLPNFQWDYFYFTSNTMTTEKFVSEIGLFNNIRSLDISKVHLQSVAHLMLIPRYLTHLKFNFHHTYHRQGCLKMSDVSILPRSITHLTLIQCPWMDSNENTANDFCSLLPPNLTYFCLEDLNQLWNLTIAFSQMRSSLRHLQTLIIDTHDSELDTFNPWLPCDTLHTLEIIAKEGNTNMDFNLFSSWPTDIPNNIKRLKFSLSGDYEPHDDEYLQKLPPHLTSLTLEGQCFLINPSFFGSLPKSVTFLELSTSFPHQEEEEFYYDDCLKDTVIVRHCPKHIELHMNYIFSGAYLPSKLMKLKITDHGRILEVIPRPKLPKQLRYCNLSYVKLDSNCIIPGTLTELDFSSDPIDMALVSKTLNLQRLTGSLMTDPMDLSNFTSLKFLRLYSSLDEYFGPPEEEEEGIQTTITTSLQELVIQSPWTEKATAYKLSQKFPNITSLKIVDHDNGGKPHLLFPTVPNKNKKIETGSATPQLPVLSKLQYLETRGDLTITQSQLKHMTPNLTLLAISSVIIDNLKEILQSLTPDTTELRSEIEIIKAICPKITTLGTPPPKILFLGPKISFPADCKSLLSQLETLEEEV